MRFLSREAYLHEGEFRVDLNTLCRCKIGLVDIILPNINQKHKDNNCIDIYCDQIDSNFDKAHAIAVVPMNPDPPVIHNLILLLVDDEF